MSAPPPGDLAVLCDFDGTITEEDVCLALLDEFGGHGWRELEEQYEQGQIDLQTCLVGQVALLGATRADMAAWARQHARLRAGFGAFVAYCRQQGLPLRILSAGLDFYIEEILAREGLAGLEVTCIGTEVTPSGVAVRLPLAGYADLRSLADFKSLLVQEEQARGRRVVFVGDGSTDFQAARLADYVFARAKLAEYCRRTGIPYAPFATFAEVQAGVEDLLANGTW
ncbi:MAG: HAD-IB family phosphatase [Chloroflexota bacterium]